MRLAVLAAILVLTPVPALASGEEPVVFDHRGGNEWWVQVRVAGDVERVQAKDTDGRWKELSLRDWGDWAGSFRIEPGHEVRFRALDDGVWHRSCWFSHPEGVTRSGGATCPGKVKAPATFDAQFTTDGGNEWWVEVDVQADRELAGVDARVSGGDWVALQQQSWGAWAKSFHVPDGSIVEFRATATSGATDVSSAYIWPEGTPAGTDVAFAPRAGNEWWVETYAVADAQVRLVEARADGDWHALAPRAWGTWAGSFHVPAGSHVTFRATTEGGVDVSDPFVWPEARPPGSQGTWPEEGSYLHYSTSASDPAPSTTEGTETLVYHSGSWWSGAQWQTSFEDRTVAGTSFCTDARVPVGPTKVAIGERVAVQVGTCHVVTYEVYVTGEGQRAVHRDGQPVTVATWMGERTDECGCLGWDAEWSQDGLLLHAHQAGRGSAVRDLVDTDAPV